MADLRPRRPSCGRPGGSRPARAVSAAIRTCAAPCGAPCAPGASRSAGPGWRPAERPRRLVLLLRRLRVMEPYARALARFAHAAVRPEAAGRVEVFTLGTRLTRITRELARRDPDAALADGGARRCADWSGGTRLGDEPPEFNDRVGRAGHGPGRGRRHLQRRLGPGRPGPARRRRWPACRGWPAGWCGSTRSRPRPGTPRWPAGWPRPSRMLIDFVEGHRRVVPGAAGRGHRRSARATERR